MLDLATKGGHRLYEMRRLSEKTVYENFVKDYRLLYEDISSDIGSMREGSKDAASMNLHLERLCNFDWIAQAIILSCLLEFGMYLSLQLQTVNVLP